MEISYGVFIEGRVGMKDMGFGLSVRFHQSYNWKRGGNEKSAVNY